MKLKVITGMLLTLFLMGVLAASDTVSVRGDITNIIKASSGKIAYDTFSALNGTATDIPWTIMEDSDLRINGDWIVEESKFKSVSSSSSTAVTYPTNVNITDFVWEVKVRPMYLTQEGPEMCFGDLPINTCSLEAVFDYYRTGNVLRVMIAPGPYGTPHSTYQTASFVMNEGVWYTMKVVVSSSNMKCYVNNVLVFDIVDLNLGKTPFRVLRHQGYYNGEWGYWDDVKIWKSNIITVTNLVQGQKVELFNASNTLLSSATVGVGENNATLDVSVLIFPFEGYFRVYATDGVTLLYTTPLDNDIWGGDQYSILPPVGGIIISINKLELLMPYIAIVSVILATVATVAFKYRKKQ